MSQYRSNTSAASRDMGRATLSVRTTLQEHRTDAIICLLLAAANATYLMLRRWPLGSADEAYDFYHAIRMLEGEVPYRDHNRLLVCPILLT